MLNLIKDYQVISIIGSAKNVGKTTVLNYLINNLEDESYALTSIGYDGESIDSVFGNSKPRIYVKKTAIIATSSKSLSQSDITYKVVDVTNIETALGKVVIIEALSDGYVILAGATIKNDVKIIVDKLKKYKVKHILIDGAIDRMSSADNLVTDAIIYATGASYTTDMIKLVEDTFYKVNLFNNKLIYKDYEVENFFNGFKKTAILLDDEKIITSDKSIISDPDFIFDNLKNARKILIDGSLTDSFAKELFHKINLKHLDIILRNPLGLFISKMTYELLLMKKVKIMFYQSAKVLAVTINPYFNNNMINKDEFRRLFQEKSKIPVFDVVGDNR